MARKTDTLRDQYLRPIPGALVSVTAWDGSAAVLTDDDAQPLDNPFYTDSYGIYTFNTAAGVYTLGFNYGGRVVLKEVVTVGTPDADLGTLLTLASEDGAALVGADDSDGGSLFTTVQGFIGRLMSSDGTSLVGFLPSGTGAVTRTAQDKFRDRVTTADYATLQQAINTGAREVIVNTEVSVSTTVGLRANQILRFAGGKIVVPGSSSLGYPDAVLFADTKDNVVIIDPVIDASARPGAVGVPAIRLLNSSNVRITGGILTRANILLESTDNTIDRKIRISDTTLNMDTHAGSAMYFSGIRGVSVSGVDMFDGGEGVGIYNGARSIDFNSVRSYRHLRDGFLINAGQEISHINCHSFDNLQSGFTSQRQVSGDDSRVASWVGCHAWQNNFDGFDIRGKNSGAAYGKDTAFSLSSCVSRENVRAGYYVVLAEGTTLTGCTGVLNELQNLFVDGSNRVIVTGFRSVSGASAEATGANKAGILIYNSNNVQMAACTSGNSEGVTQEYGLSFTGTSVNGRVVGGDFSGNSVGPFAGVSNAILGAYADTLAGSGVFFLGMSQSGTYTEEGTTVPAHTRPKGSLFTRTNGGGGELYISNGAGSWSKVALV